MPKTIPTFCLTALLSLFAFVGLRPVDAAQPAGSPPGNTHSPGSLQSASRETLLFSNGDLLYGALESIAPQTGVRWRHPDVEQPIEFGAEHIKEVRFPPRRSPAQVTPNTCRLQLSNRDELEGDILSFNSSNAVLKTWYAGEIVVPRKFIQLVSPVPPDGATVFQGPTGLDGWTIGKVVSALGDAGEWKYRNGAFYATNAASIARKLALPDVSIMEFDLAWKGLFQLAIAIYTDYLQPINLANKETEPEFSGFYSIQLNSFSANLLPVKKNDPLRYLGQVSVPAFNQKNAAHVEIRSHKAKRAVTLVVDGQVIKQWIDTEEFAGQGSGVRFVHQGQGKVKLSNLRVTEWDGQSDEVTTTNPQGKQDVARLRNGDKVVGQVQSIQEGRLTMAIGDAPLVIPLNRVRLVELAGDQVQRTTPEPSSVRAVFGRGGAVTFLLEKWEDGQALGTNAAIGRLSFDARAFSRLELGRPK
jgi:hypothetical protein